MGALADEQTAADVVPERRQLVDLREEGLRIDDDAVADGAGDVGMENPRRQKPEDDLLRVDVDRVAGVVPALIARNDGKARRQQIDDLALALVTPLRTEYCDVHGRHILHCCAFSLRIPKANIPRSSIDVTRDLSNKFFFIFKLTTQARGLNFCLSFSRTPSRICAHTRITHGVQTFTRTAHPRRVRRVTIAHPGRARRLPHGTDATALPAARPHRADAVPAHRSRAIGDDTRALLQRDRQRVAVQGAGARAAGVRARSVRRRARIFRSGTFRGRQRTRDVPLRRSARAAHLREFPGPADGVAGTAEDAGHQPEPLRADDALCLTGSSTSEGCDGPVRGHPRAAASPWRRSAT